MGDVPDVARQEVAIGAGHEGRSLECRFWGGICSLRGGNGRPQGTNPYISTRYRGLTRAARALLALLPALTPVGKVYACAASNFRGWTFLFLKQ
jgi:hypothetical protein